MDFQRFWRRLQHLGLNAYQARSYLVSIGHPRFNALELAAPAHVPRQKICEVNAKAPSGTAKSSGILRLAGAAWTCSTESKIGSRVANPRQWLRRASGGEFPVVRPARVPAEPLPVPAPHSCPKTASVPFDSWL